MIKIRIENDPDTENPLDCDQFVLHSFSTRHTNFKHPDELGIQEDGSCSKLGLRRKIECGTAWVLGYYEHSGSVWFLKGEAPAGCNCPWDGTPVAGVLEWKGKPKDLHEDAEKRTECVRGLLETYSEWCNGHCYWYCIEDENGETIDSCGGFIGSDHLFDCMHDANAELFAGLSEEDVEFAGIGMVDFDDLRKGQPA